VKRKSPKKNRNKSKKGANGGLGLLAPGNVGLARLLLRLATAGPDGMPTNVLLEELSSSHYGQITIRRAFKQGLIDRVTGERPGPGEFPPRYNRLTDKGREDLASLSSKSSRS
jgi:hypothetical protein